MSGCAEIFGIICWKLILNVCKLLFLSGVNCTSSFNSILRRVVIIEVKLVLRGLYVGETVPGWHTDKITACRVDRQVRVKVWGLVFQIVEVTCSHLAWSVNQSCIVDVVFQVSRICMDAILLQITENIEATTLLRLSELGGRLFKYELIDVSELLAILLFLPTGRWHNPWGKRSYIPIAARSLISPRCVGTSDHCLSLIDAYDISRISFIIMDALCH